MRASEKESLEVEKLSQEIDKIKEEIKIAKGNNRRFRWGNIYVPLGVALGTYLIIHSTGYFNAWQMKNEIAASHFKDDTTKWNAIKDSVVRRIDVLTNIADSLKLKKRQDSAVISKQQENLKNYQDLIKGGLTNDKQKIILIKQNDSLKVQNTHLNILLGDKDEKNNFVASSLLIARADNKLLLDSIKKINAQQNYFNSMTLDEYQKRVAWLRQDTGLKGLYIRILTHVLDSLKIKHI